MNGDIELKNQSTVRGDIVIEGEHRGADRDDEISIRLDDRSTVEGDIVVEDERLRVVVYLRGGSKVLGKIKNAEVVEE
ncbi:hypothetical protein GWN26_11320 [Candidatus Saccharibacteria bacterium]|nr:hypothetical protein [Candidatus Saccharibacteria bacterium]NIV99673.1 hypothetical protein [Candidatus Saccharibacteria bacterium]NIW79075.1 hypothetical protein [Calditrichia bacterium]